MSASTFEWTPTTVVAPLLLSEKDGGRGCRGREFQESLDRYSAAYIAHQIDRARAISSGVRSHELTWLRPLRRLLAAIAEIWLFSHQVCGDWRHPDRGSSGGR
jgi:hypothetical protein